MEREIEIHGEIQKNTIQLNIRDFIGQASQGAIFSIYRDDLLRELFIN
ncbi:MAG: hypothetical protein KGY74_09325 [Candidatus Cloacimonetes bacterium]|nr:hypothetical protein [Candidatus Cloacimonadota bacterium]